MGSFLSDSLFKSFSRKYITITSYDTGLVSTQGVVGVMATSDTHTQEADKLLNGIGRNSLLGNRKKIAKF